MAERGENVRLDWSSAEGMAVQPVNIVLVQAGPDSHVLNLGFVTPPIHAESLESVPVHTVARVLLTPDTVGLLIDGLAENARHREGRQREEGAGSDD